MDDRRLAAIMFTDIVGYTAMMGSDEQKALRAVEAQRDILMPLVAAHGGTWLKEMGDGTLSSFTSTVSAVNCAIAAQTRLADNGQFQIRIGIHLGDVVFTATDVFGDGVNVAARVEATAAPGGISITGQVYDTLQSSTAVETCYLGERSLKNVGRPLKLFAVTNDGLPVPEAETGMVAGMDVGKVNGSDNSRTAFGRFGIVAAALVVIAVIGVYVTLNPEESRQSDEPLDESLVLGQEDFETSVAVDSAAREQAAADTRALADSPQRQADPAPGSPAPLAPAATLSGDSVSETRDQIIANADTVEQPEPLDTVQAQQSEETAAVESGVGSEVESETATAATELQTEAPPETESEIQTATTNGQGNSASNLSGEASQASFLQDKSIAVLPLTNLSADPENAYFAAGIHEEILSQLSKISDMRVISRRSVLRFEDSTESIREIADELGVETIMEGSVRFAGDRVRINCTLIRAADQSQLWSETYERELQDIFAIQSDVAIQAANAMQAELLPNERERIEAPATSNTEAYTLYLQTLYRGEQESLRVTSEPGSWIDLGIRDLQRAVELDPEFAAAYAHLAYVQSFNGFNQLFSGRDTEMEAQAMENARRALELDPNISKAYSVLAIDAALNRRWSEFEDYANQIEALPDIETTTYSDIAMSYALMQRYDDARQLIARAIESDPDSATIRWLAILVNIVSRDYEEVLVMSDRFLAVGGDRNAYYLYRAVALHFLGQEREAASELTQISGDLTDQDFAFYAFYAYLNCSNGSIAETNQFALQQTFFNLTLTNLGCRLGVNDADGFFQTLQPLMATGIAFPDVGEAMDGMRDDPRYALLEEYLNLPD